MHIKATRKIENSIMSTTLTVDALGSSTMTADEEREVLNDYKLEINYGSILFSRFVKLNDHKDPEIVVFESMNEDTDPATGDDTGGDNTNPATEPATDPAADEPQVEADLITLAMPGDTYRITEDMELRYAVDVTTLKNKLENYQYISDEACLGKCMLLTFEDVVISWIKQQLEISKQHRDNFESEKFYEI